MQTRKQIAEEVAVNTTLGLSVNWIISFVVISLVESAAIASTMTVILCTVWSLYRNYMVRKYYNRKHASSTSPHR